MYQLSVLRDKPWSALWSNTANSTKHTMKTQHEDHQDKQGGYADSH